MAYFFRVKCQFNTYISEVCVCSLTCSCIIGPGQKQNKNLCCSFLLYHALQRLNRISKGQLVIARTFRGGSQVFKKFKGQLILRAGNNILTLIQAKTIHNSILMPSLQPYFWKIPLLSGAQNVQAKILLGYCKLNSHLYKAEGLVDPLCCP